MKQKGRKIGCIVPHVFVKPQTFLLKNLYKNCREIFQAVLAPSDTPRAPR